MAFLFLCPLLHCSDLSDLMFMSSSPCGLPPPPCRAICHQCHVSVPTPSSLRSDIQTKKSGAHPALVFRHIVSLIVVSFRTVSLLFRTQNSCFASKQAKLGGQFCYFASKSFALKQNLGTPYAQLIRRKTQSSQLLSVIHVAKYSINY